MLKQSKMSPEDKQRVLDEIQARNKQIAEYEAENKLIDAEMKKLTKKRKGGGT